MIGSGWEGRGVGQPWGGGQHSELKQSWALPVYSVLGRKVKSVRRKIGQAKNHIKKTGRTNIIATNFV